MDKCTMTTPKSRPETPAKRPARWTGPVNSAKRGTNAPPQNLDEFIEHMDRTPDSGIAMCHARGKTAVYVSEDRRYIVEHPPHGPITRRPRDLGTTSRP